MTRTICDICGKEIDTRKMPKVINDYPFSISLRGVKLDVCEKCRKNLYDWINNNGTKWVEPKSTSWSKGVI